MKKEKRNTEKMVFNKDEVRLLRYLLKLFFYKNKKIDKFYFKVPKCFKSKNQKENIETIEKENVKKNSGFWEFYKKCVRITCFITGIGFGLLIFTDKSIDYLLTDNKLLIKYFGGLLLILFLRVESTLIDFEKIKKKLEIE